MTAARSINEVTTVGTETMGRWPLRTALMWAPARLAIDRCTLGGRTWSSVPISYHDGMLFQAGTVDGSVRAPKVTGRWVAASTCARHRGRSFAKYVTKDFWSTNGSVVGVGAPSGTGLSSPGRLSAESGPARAIAGSPSSGANASR